MIDWKDISTVPDDVHDILGCTENGMVRVCTRKLFKFPDGRWEWFRDQEHCPGHTWSIVPKWWAPIELPPELEGIE